MSTPTHDDIAQRARQLWREHGSPAGRDDELWLMAERQLLAKAANAEAAPAPQDPAFIERIKTETAAESVVENHISPAIPDQEAIQAALQKQSARAPQVPHHTGPPAKPPVSGKPVWNKPHSS